MIQKAIGMVRNLVGGKPIAMSAGTGGPEGGAVAPDPDNPTTATIAAAAGDKAKVSGVAYTGGMVRLPNWPHPVVVDLSGLELDATVPLLVDHINAVDRRIGWVKPTRSGQILAVDGEVVDTGSEMARNVIVQGKAKVDWQLSIGAVAERWENIAAGKTMELNGQLFGGPFTAVLKGALREVSVVAVGAAKGTSLRMVEARMDFSGIPANGTNPDKEMVMNEEFKKWLAASGLTTEGMGPETLRMMEKMFELSMSQTAKPTEKPMSTTPAAPIPATGGSTVPAGSTSATISASAAPTGTATLDAAGIQAAAKEEERARVLEIQKMCMSANAAPEILAKAVQDSWSVDRTAKEILAKQHEQRPPATMIMGSRQEPVGGDAVKTLEATLCLRAGIDGNELVSGYGEKTVEQADRWRNMHLKEMIARIVCMHTGSMPFTVDNDEIRAAFSTTTLPGILSNVANKRLMRGYQAYPAIATRLCTEGNLTDFKESERYRMTDLGDLEHIPEGGEFKHGTLTEERAGNRLKTYGKAFTLTRQMIVNDDLSAFLEIPAAMGARAARKIDELFFRRLMGNPVGADKNALFSDAHKNLISGADSALGPVGLGKLKTLFQKQVDKAGTPLALLPKFLMVPPELEQDAIALLGSSVLMPVGGTEKRMVPTFNPLGNPNQPDAAHRLELVSAPFLSLDAYPNASAKAFYLFGNPVIQDTFEIGYYNGRKFPIVEKTEVNFESLGMKFRVYYDLGVREQDFRGMSKSKGEA